MPFKVEFIQDSEKNLPPLLHNTFSDYITTNEVLQSVQQTIDILDKQKEPIDVVAIFEKGSSMLGAKDILFHSSLIDQFTWHPKLAELFAVELNKGLYGSFIRTILNMAKNRPALKVTVFAKLKALDEYLDKKYQHSR